MKRNVLLFVCLCLGASLLVIHFHQPSDSSAPVNSAAATPARNLPVAVADAPTDATPSAVPVATTSVVQAAQNPVAEPAPTLVAEDAAKVPTAGLSNTNAADKFKVLRDLTAWAAKDPEAALAAILKLPEGDQRNEALAAVCSGIAQTDPADAVKVAQDLHLDKQPGAVMEDLVQQWASSDLASSLAWAEDQPAGASRDEFTTRIAFIMSHTDPSDAATLVMNQIPPGPAQDEAIMSVLNQWANQDFVAAANWAKGITGSIQPRVIAELTGIFDYHQALAQQ